MTDPSRPSDDELAAEDEALTEAGLVVEGDELVVDGSDEDPEPDEVLTDDEIEDSLAGSGDPTDADDPGSDEDPDTDDAPDDDFEDETDGADETDETDGAPEPDSESAAHEDHPVPAHAFADHDEDETEHGGEHAAAAGAVDGGDDRPGRHLGRKLLLALVLVLGVLYLAGWFLTGVRMPANATIGGVDVGGRSPSAAREALDEALTPRVDREIELVSGKKEFRVKPQDAGLALDVDRSVDQAGGRRSWDPRDMIALVAGQHDEAPALDVDDAALQSAIGTISASVDREVVEAQISFRDAEPVPREPRPGRVVSRSQTAAAIRAAYLVDDDPIRVPTVAVEPTVDSEGLAEAVRTVAKPAVSGPVTLRVGDKKVALPVSAYAPALVIRVESGRLVPHLDPKKLAKPLTGSTTGIGRKAVDATVRIEDGKPVVVPGKSGVGLQPGEMARKLEPVLTETGSRRSVTIRAKVVEPAFTTKDAKALRIREKISDFTTQFPYAEYRNTNQGRAAELIDGTIVEPGEIFSFNDVVGERTEANGFVTGTVINGGVFREELGGGVSQVATTTYNAAFFGGMDDTEHHPHAFYIDRYPVGREATVYYGSLDLRWKNPTKYGVLVRSYVVKSTPSSPGQMHVELWSTKVWDKIEAGQSKKRNARKPGTQYDDTSRCVAQAPVEGFDIDIYRRFVRDGDVVKTETDTANYQAADKVVCGKKPKAD
jgi:vancomycin resistance protein YoaR